MKTLIALMALMSFNAFALSGMERFKIEMVKPMGQFGFRVLGQGKSITEMRFDCSRAAEMGIVLSVVNNYGKSSTMVMPGQKIGSDKFECQRNLKNYFGVLHSRRDVASSKSKVVEINFDRGGLFSDSQETQHIVLR